MMIVRWAGFHMHIFSRVLIAVDCCVWRVVTVIST